MTTVIPVDDRTSNKPVMIRGYSKPQLDDRGAPIFAIHRTLIVADASRLKADLICYGGSLQINEAFVTTLEIGERENLAKLCVSGKPRRFFLRNWNGLWLAVARFALRRVRKVTKENAS